MTPSTILRVVFAAFLLVASVLVSASATAAESAENDKYGVSAPAEAKLVHRLPDRDAVITHAPAPSTFVVVGDQVLDAEKAAVVGNLKTEIKNAQMLRALSPTGRFFAHQDEAEYVTFIQVFDCRSGGRLHTLRYTEEKFRRLEYLGFTSYDHLIAVASLSQGSGVFVWNMQDGRLLKELRIPRASADKIAFSRDGRHLASVATSTLQVFDVVQGNPVATMATPSSELGSSIFIFIRGLAFSPDGTELAGLMQGKEAQFRLVVWDAKGEIIDDHPLGLQIGGAYNEGHPVHWAPDAGGWLVHGNYFLDRKLGAIAWILHSPVMHHYPHRFLDPDHVLTSRGDFSARELVAVKFPRQKIHAAVESLNSGGPAVLKPGQTINLAIEVGDALYAEKAEVEKSLEEAITKRLKVADLRIGKNQPVTLHVKYSASKGDKLRVVEGGPIPYFQRDTGQRVKETVGVFEARLTAEGSDKPIWEQVVRKGNPRIIREEKVNNAKVREAMFNNIQYMIKVTEFPYFVPGDPAAPRLPLISAP